MSITITKIAGLKPRDWIQRDGIVDGTVDRGEVRSVDDKGGAAQWVNGTQGRFEWDDPGLCQIDPPQAAPAATGTLLEVPAENAARHNGGVILIPVDDICPFSLQARSAIDAASLEGLAQSIRERGLQQPITVRPAHPSLGKPYEIVCGERRWRASILAGVTEIEARVRDVDNREAVLLATEENSQRENLGPLEISRNIRLLEQVGVLQAEIGALFPDRYGKPRSQSWVSRTADLVSLPAVAQGYLESGRLSQSHGEELLSLRRWPKELIDLAEQCVAGEWTANALAANVRTLRGRMEAKERLPLDEAPATPAPRTTTTRETTTETTVTTETVSAPEPVATPPPAEPVNAAEPFAVADEAPELSAAPDEVEPAPKPATEAKPNALKAAEELVAFSAGTAVPTTIGAAVLDGPVTMCMVLQDCQAWVAAEGLTVKDFLGRLKAAAYTRGLDAGSLLASLEVS